MVLDGFFSYLLDALFPERCIICGESLVSSDSLPPVTIPAGWPAEALAFLGSDFSVRLFPGIRVAARVLCTGCWLSLEPALPVTSGGEDEHGGVCGDTGLPPPRSAGGAFPSIPLVSPFFTNDSLLEVVKYLKFSGGIRAVPPLSWWMARALRMFLSGLRIDNAGDVIVTAVPLHPSRQRRRGYNQAALLGAHTAGRLGLPFLDGILVRTKKTRYQSHLSEEMRAENVRDAFRLGRGRGVGGRHVILVDDLVTTGETVGACVRAICEAVPISVAVLAAGRVRR